MRESPKIGCIGAGASGVGQMVMMERFRPGCCVAFSDLDRSLFDQLASAYLGDENSDLGDFRTDTTLLRRSFKDLPYYKDPDEMLEKEDIDTVIIATWCSAHAEMVKKCVRHGVNIIVEKPMATNEQDLDSIWEDLKNYPKAAMVNFTMRGAPVSVAARNHVRRGDIGDIVSVQYVNNVHYGDSYFRRWHRKSEISGSLLLQKAVHDLDMINYIIGRKPVSIAAFGSRLVYGGDMPNDLTCDDCELKWDCDMSIYNRQLIGDRPLPVAHCRGCVYAKEVDIDDNQVVIIQYEGGATASYCQTFNAPHGGCQRGGNFIGSKGIMDLRYYGEFKEMPGTCATLIGNSQITIRKLYDKPGSRIHETFDWAARAHFDGNEHGTLEQLKVLSGQPSDIAGTARDGYISAKMCIAAQNSIETGQVITLDLDL
jgi:predicted dehydrogenase